MCYDEIFGAKKEMLIIRFIYFFVVIELLSPPPPRCLYSVVVVGLVWCRMVGINLYDEVGAHELLLSNSAISFPTGN
jgi:hypothetical protein